MVTLVVVFLVQNQQWIRLLIQQIPLPQFLEQTLSSPRILPSATSNSTHGYFSGGLPGPVTTMDKVTYSSDTTAAVPGANLVAARYAHASTGNTTHGYHGGGGPGSAPISTVDKTTYSSDTTAALPSAQLTVLAYSFRAATGSRDHGLPTAISSPAPNLI